MPNIDYVMDVCNQIARNNKTPSMGLIKSYADQSLPIPLIISALNRWKGLSPSERAAITVNTVETIDTKTDSDHRISKLEKEVTNLKQELKALSSLVTELSSK